MIKNLQNSVIFMCIHVCLLHNIMQLILKQNSNWLQERVWSLNCNYTEIVLLIALFFYTAPSKITLVKMDVYNRVFLVTLFYNPPHSVRLSHQSIYDKMKMTKNANRVCSYWKFWFNQWYPILKNLAILAYTSSITRMKHVNKQ